MGMSIVNGLLSQMGTQLEVKSTYGKGSTFSFSLEQTVRDWEEIGTREEAQKALLQEATLYTESFQAPNAKILVIDDTPVNLTVMRGLLKNTRVQIDTAQSGEEALQLVRKNEYHILFVDHLMPKMDGIEFLAENFADSESINKNTPAVALTANAVSGAKDMYLKAGFDDYLSKPIDPKKLEEMISHLLPKELLVLPGDKDFVEVAQSEWNGVERRESVCEVSEIFGELFGLDIEAALKNCGGKEVFKTAVSDFYDAIEEKSNLIEEYAKNSDWKNYTILVHALKSSARLIGAGELSELAKQLEEAGNAAQKESVVELAETTTLSPSISKIHEQTLKLLVDYRAYLLKLSVLVGKTPQNAGEQTKKELISSEKLAEAFCALKEVVSVFDFDSADVIVSELDGYAIPSEEQERVEKIKKAVRTVDASVVLALLK